MSTTGQARSGPAAARLLALLAVVLGLLAMHGLASTHHAAAGPGSAPTAAAAVAAPKDRAGAHRHEPASSGAREATAASSALPDGAVAPADPACGDDCSSGLAVLCAAVLAAGTAWLVIAAAARGCRLAPAAGGVPQARAPATGRRLLTGPDPVAELCVSRT